MCRSNDPSVGKETSLNSDPYESDSFSSDDEDLLESTQADDESGALPHGLEDVDAVEPPIWIACGRTFVFMGIFLAGIIVATTTFVSLSKVSYGTYIASVSEHSLKGASKLNYLPSNSSYSATCIPSSVQRSSHEYRNIFQHNHGHIDAKLRGAGWQHSSYSRAIY